MVLKQKNKLLMTCLITIASFVISSCGNNPSLSDSSSSSSSRSETTSESTSEEIVMTESYAKARDEFKEVTGMDLPIFSDMEVEPYSYKEGDTTYCFKIISGKNLKYQNYFVFEDLFVELFGEPDKSDKTSHEENNRYAEWTRNDRWYQTFWDASIKTIAINTAERKIDPVLFESYVMSREQFKEVTGLELPIVYDIEANETYIKNYEKGQKTYKISLESGKNLSFATYEIFEEFFKTKFGNCDEGYPIGSKTGESGRISKWTINEREYYCSYTSSGFIVLETNPESTEDKMTNSYKEGRDKFYQITGLWLMKLNNIELLSSSSFDFDDLKARFDFNGDASLFSSIKTYLKTNITQDPISEETNSINWNYDFKMNETDYNASFSATFTDGVISITGHIQQYYTIQLVAGEHGSVKMTYNMQEVENNTITELNGKRLLFYAYPDEEYEFTGWYIGEELISLLSPEVYLINKKSAVIVGKFEKIDYHMTESYAKAREDFYKVSNIYLPGLSGLEVEDYPYEEGTLVYNFNITGGSNLSESIFATFTDYLDEKLLGWSRSSLETEGNYEKMSYTSMFNDVINLVFDTSNYHLLVSVTMVDELTYTDVETIKNIFINQYEIDLPLNEECNILESHFSRDGSSTNIQFSNENYGTTDYLLFETAFENVLGEYSSKIEDEYGYTLTWLKDEKTFELIITSVSKIISINVH